MKKIIIKGAYGATNYGDDLLMVIFESFFLKEFENIDLYFEGMYEADYVNKMLQNSRYITARTENDWLVYGGGTQFFSYSKKEKIGIFPRIFGLFVKVFKHPEKLLHKISKPSGHEEKHNSKYIAFLGFGLGPFYRDLKKINNVTKILGNADFLSVRDKVSYEYCQEWGVDSLLGADVAYSSYFTFNIKPKPINEKKRKKIGLIVRDWVWEETGRAYIEPLKELYEGTSDFDFQYIVFAPFKDPKWMEDLKNSNVLCWNPETDTIDGFLESLNEFDAFVTARFHGAIIGALLSKPVICIEIEPKLRILTEDLPELLLWEKPFDLVSLEVLLQRLNYKIDYSESLGRLRRRADRGLSAFKDFFNSK